MKHAICAIALWLSSVLCAPHSGRGRIVEERVSCEIVDLDTGLVIEQVEVTLVPREELLRAASDTILVGQLVALPGSLSQRFSQTKEKPVQIDRQALASKDHVLVCQASGYSVELVDLRALPPGTRGLRRIGMSKDGQLDISSNATPTSTRPDLMSLEVSFDSFALCHSAQARAYLPAVRMAVRAKLVAGQKTMLGGLPLHAELRVLVADLETAERKGPPRVVSIGNSRRVGFTIPISGLKERITGVVVDDLGMPVASQDLWMVARDHEGRELRSRPPPAFATAITDAEGQFVSELPKGFDWSIATPIMRGQRLTNLTAVLVAPLEAQTDLRKSPFRLVLPRVVPIAAKAVGADGQIRGSARVDLRIDGFTGEIALLSGSNGEFDAYTFFDTEAIIQAEGGRGVRLTPGSQDVDLKRRVEVEIPSSWSATVVIAQGAALQSRSVSGVFENAWQVPIDESLSQVGLFRDARSVSTVYDSISSTLLTDDGGIACALLKRDRHAGSVVTLQVEPAGLLEIYGSPSCNSLALEIRHGEVIVCRTRWVSGRPCAVAVPPGDTSVVVLDSRLHICKKVELNVHPMSTARVNLGE